MDLTLTPEQVAMAEVVGDLLAGWHERPPTPAQRWAAVSDVGLDAAFLPADRGGLGLGLGELLPALRALGPAAASWPWAATLVAGPALAHALGHDPEETAAGPIGVALVPAQGKPRVRHPDRLHHIAIVGGRKAALIPAADWAPVARRDLLDAPSWAQAPDDATARLRPLDTPTDPVAAGRVAEAALLLGVGDRALALAVEHAKVRQQFGTPIGTFQAVKHLLAEARTELAFADPLVIGAAIAVDRQAPTACRDAAIALLAAGAAAEQAVRTSIQVHGGIGYTDEVPLGELLAAATHGVQAWGGQAQLNREVVGALATGSPHIGGADLSAATDRATVESDPSREEEQ